MRRSGRWPCSCQGPYAGIRWGNRMPTGGLTRPNGWGPAGRFGSFYARAGRPGRPSMLIVLWVRW